MTPNVLNQRPIVPRQSGIEAEEWATSRELLCTIPPLLKTGSGDIFLHCIQQLYNGNSGKTALIRLVLKARSFPWIPHSTEDLCGTPCSEYSCHSTPSSTNFTLANVKIKPQLNGMVQNFFFSSPQVPKLLFVLCGHVQELHRMIQRHQRRDVEVKIKAKLTGLHQKRKFKGDKIASNKIRQNG